MDKLFSRRIVMTVAGLLVLSLSLSSCDTLKEKFIRKKKGGEDDQNFVPVLEPEEYPSPQQDPVQNYQLHYSLIKSWYSDLMMGLDEHNSSRYLHYVLQQVTNNIDQMEVLVDGPTRQNLVKLASYLDYYKASLDEPWQVRNVSRIQSDLRGFERFLKQHLRADRIKGHFLQVAKAS